MYRQYTKCYDHTPGDKPFNESDLVKLGALYGGIPALLVGLFVGMGVGFTIGGPIGAIVGGILGTFYGVWVGVANALGKAADEWRYHRLCCVSGDRCAVGTVRKQPERADLGAFDNDQYFDLTLMPHRTGHGTDAPPGPPNGDDYKEPSDNYKVGKPGIVWDDEQKALSDHPANDVYTDGLQGEALVRPTIEDLPYDTKRSWLHCEAEGDFWERIAALAGAIGALAGLLAAGTVAAGIGGGFAGAAAGCAIGAIFGPIGCLIGAIIGAIIGALAAGAAAGYISAKIIEAVLQGIFDGSGAGNVEDANVGDASFGPISAGDRVVVYGTHVYDGFHQGWHEIHPLKAVIKAAALHGRGGLDVTPYYLEWNPAFPSHGTLPADDLPGLPPDAQGLTVDDMRKGLNSDRFRRRAEWIRNRWCDLLHESFTDPVKENQGTASQRWTIHPDVDGCVEARLVARISKPAEGTWLPADRDIDVELQGAASGGTAPIALRWTVTRASTGVTTDVGASASAVWKLAKGANDKYTVTLTATDAGGHTASASVTVATYVLR